ncbi:MAG: EAL domain-containing protein [Moraxellaceae bacterium]|nr:EAL domain-containing protein [Moraxellaceae bacterium]
MQDAISLQRLFTRNRSDDLAGTAGDARMGVDHQRMLSTLERNLDGMVFRCSIDAHWTMQYVSEGCRALTGYSGDALVGNREISYEAITHPEDRNTVREQIEAALSAGDRYRVEYRISHRDGGVRWVVERGTQVRDEHGQMVLEGFVQDITLQVAALQQQIETELRYHSIFDNSAIGIFQTSVDGHYLAANPALAKLYGYASPSELMTSLQDIGTHLYVDPKRRAEFKRRIREHGRVVAFESEVMRRDGQRIWIAENAHAVVAPDGSVLYYEGTVEDVSERRRVQAQLEYQANHDLLTGLPNRHLLDERLDHAIRIVRRHGGGVTVAFIDLDNFKLINDSLGHAAGDSLLVEVSQRLSHCLRDSDTVARYGGDEFVLILTDHGTDGETERILDRVLASIAEPLVVEEQELRVSCSIGAARYPADGDDLDTLMRHADAAMYLSKSRGKNQYSFFTGSLNTAATERLQLESSLRGALEREEFCVVLQPKVGADRRVTGFEALLRWTSEECGAVSPAKFIPIAEEIGLMPALTTFVLREACQQARTWPRTVGHASLHVAVNLSARLFQEQDIASLVRDTLQETGLDGRALELEITESMLVGDVAHTARVLADIKALGVGVAVDDFGTGYSSLAYLGRLPLDTLKIDRSFVNGCDRGGQALLIPRAVISLGHGLGMKVVAEGVENELELATLIGLGCDEFQGYLFARPMAADAVPAWLLRSQQPN